MICSGAAMRLGPTVMMVDGWNNHRWRKTTPVLNWCLWWRERFAVTVVTGLPM